MKSRWIQLFIYSSGAILLLAALERFLIVYFGSHILRLLDPLLEIQVGHAAMVVGGIEFTVALLCLFGQPVAFPAGCLAWLATNWALYRIGLLWIHAQAKGSCLGSLTDPFHLSHGAIGFVLKFIPFYLLLGSYAAVAWLWLECKKNRSAQSVAMVHIENKSNRAAFARFLKISCIACGGHLEFPTNLFGGRISCPHCQATITLQKARNLKISCPLCGGHIEFPEHAIGQTIPCPHCTKTITLLNPA